tara:strand:+ start:166 stop:468 length:303 start_codon:yes stop_codon:yes gene_type:complete
MTYPYPDKLEPHYNDKIERKRRLEKANDFSEKPPETTINQMADEIVAMIVENEDINSHEELMDFESQIFMDSRPVQDLVDKVYCKLSEKNFPIEKRRPSK